MDATGEEHECLFEGMSGFEELRKYIKQGSDFCKDVALIIHERADLETRYASGLSKLSTKLTKATTGNLGTLVDGWRAVSVLMEQEAELHKNLGAALLDEISKPLKSLVETQIRAMRPIEVAVDKSMKSLSDRRNEEYKAKKNCYSCARENEKGQETKTDCENGKGKHSDKDVLKIQRKCDSLARQLKKADEDYRDLCEKAEAARQEWELSVSKGSSQLQTLEEEMMSKLAEHLTQYNSQVAVMGPRLTQNCDKLHEAVDAVDHQSDLRNVAEKRVSNGNIPEQILFDSYAEDLQFTMNAERRKNALEDCLKYVQQSLEREKKGREGVKKLAEVYKARPGFANQETQDDTKQRLYQVMFTINFLEASHCKIASALAEVECQNKLEHKFAKYIESTKDKQGIQTSTLRLPIDIALEWADEEDEFSDGEFEKGDEFDGGQPIGKCRVIYDYQASQTDELSISSGDVISIHEKQDDGWWEGELNGQKGLFPATYVEEI